MYPVLVGPDGLDLAQNVRIISRLEKPAVMPCSDCNSVMVENRSLETDGYFAKARRWRVFLRVSGTFSLSAALSG
jgi:hypothetical protein